MRGLSSIEEALAEFRRPIELRLAWEAANPEIARAWNEALEENDRREVAKAHAMEEARIGEHLRRCGVGGRTAEVIAAGLRNTRALEVVRGWIDEGATFCLLLGRPGTGKTIAAAWALRNARRVFRDERDRERWEFDSLAGLFTKAHDLAEAMHSGWDLTKRARSAPWLVIDEIGSEYSDQAGRWLAELDALLDARYEGRRRTVITTNMSAEAFKARYGERITSRIRGDGVIADCGATDLRRPSAVPSV